jgi:hypothetical protein
MKTNSNDPINAVVNSHGFPSLKNAVIDNSNEQLIGLTKREIFAAMAMQGLMANIDPVNHKDYIAENSVKIADALIKELNKE